MSMADFDGDVLDAEDMAEFTRVVDVMGLMSNRCEALRLLGFEARWEWRSADRYPLIRIGRRTW